jgi:hypothetical protein
MTGFKSKEVHRNIDEGTKADITIEAQVMEQIITVRLFIIIANKKSPPQVLSGLSDLWEKCLLQLCQRIL